MLANALRRASGSLGLTFPRLRGEESDLDRTLCQIRKEAFYAPTPWTVARQMLELATVGPEDTVYDLGSGDGRIPIMAAQEFGCRSVGIELDEKLLAYAQERVRRYGLEDRVRFRREDFFEARFEAATVVTLYLLSQVNGYLAPWLASQLGKRARVVALDYEVPGWRMEKAESVKSEGNVDYTLFLYRR
jgi:SAM-dependent methyltransferase